MPDLPTLTAKQEAFVREYTLDRNGTQAAIRAGYSQRTANEQAAQLLAKLSIRQAIQSLDSQLAERTHVTKEWLIAEATATYTHARALGQTAAAKGALELVGKLHGYVVEKRDLRVIRSVEDMTDEELAAVTQGADQQKGVVH